MPASKIQPPYLKQGDEVMIVSPSFCIDPDKLSEAEILLERWGLNVRTGRNAARRYGPFAGRDEERLADLQEATNDPSVKAVICSRGGYGALRIADKVDFSPLKKHPKWYVGFSDITVLHLWLSEVHNLISIHGEMPLNYKDPGKSSETLSTLQKALFGKLENISWKAGVFREREIKGEITGGNLSLFYSLIGTRSEPQTKGRILFLEETGEYFYHVDRMLTSLKLAGKLEGLAALVIGGMNKIESTSIQWGRTPEETILDAVEDYDYPVLFDFPAGHTADNRAFYIGRNAEIKISGKTANMTFS